jgi:1-acyl-sn-glycerol-3-phosphate acyltransferase|uniref:lysophospholipid acyltransferase family protein n=1 Tax=Prosthecobacter sp. TaxID=1965333 RepID=UPI003783293C
MNDWTLDPAHDRDLLGIERHRSLVRENGLASSVLRFVMWSLLRPALNIWHRPRINGREHLPKSRPFILVSNHTSHLDGILLASLLPTSWRDHVFPVAASDTFFEKRSAAAFAARFLNALAIRRRGAHNHDLEEMRKRLTRDKEVFIIFPEGTRSRTGEMSAFRSGIGRLVAKTSVPVVPCYLEGCFRAWPPGRHFSKPLSVGISIGPPMTFEDCSDDRAGWDSIAKRLQAAVVDLAAC